MFIHSLRILFYLPTRSRLRLFPLPPTRPRSLFCHRFAGRYLLLFWPAAGTVAVSINVDSILETARIRAFASSLQGPLRPTEPEWTNSACINNSVTSFSSGSHWGDELNGQAFGALVCGRGWGRGCLQLQQLALCVKWSWKTTMECWVHEWNPEQQRLGSS